MPVLRATCWRMITSVVLTLMLSPPRPVIVTIVKKPAEGRRRKTPGRRIGAEEGRRRAVEQRDVERRREERSGARRGVEDREVVLLQDAGAGRGDTVAPLGVEVGRAEAGRALPPADSCCCRRRPRAGSRSRPCGVYAAPVPKSIVDVAGERAVLFDSCAAAVPATPASRMSAAANAFASRMDCSSWFGPTRHESGGSSMTARG